MRRLSYLSAILMLLSIIEGCQESGSELTPLYQTIDCINKFFQEGNRLPENNDELQDYGFSAYPTLLTFQLTFKMFFDNIVLE